MRVLVVEDDPLIGDALAIGLGAEGFVVDLADRGDDGLWMATENDYDAIVLDAEGDAELRDGGAGGAPALGLLHGPLRQCKQRRRGDAECRGRSACRGPLPHHPRPPTSHRADAETPRVVAAPRAADRCPTTRAHQRLIAPSWRRRVPGPLRVPPTAAPPPALTKFPSRRRGDAVCRGRPVCRRPLRHHPRPPTSHRAAGHHGRGCDGRGNAVGGLLFC